MAVKSEGGFWCCPTHQNNNHIVSPYVTKDQTLSVRNSILDLPRGGRRADGRPIATAPQALWRAGCGIIVITRDMVLWHFNMKKRLIIVGVLFYRILLSTRAVLQEASVEVTRDTNFFNEIGPSVKTSNYAECESTPSSSRIRWPPRSCLPDGASSPLLDARACLSPSWSRLSTSFFSKLTTLTTGICMRLRVKQVSESFSMKAESKSKGSSDRRCAKCSSGDAGKRVSGTAS